MLFINSKLFEWFKIAIIKSFPTNISTFTVHRGNSLKLLMHASKSYLYVSPSPPGGGGFCHRNWKNLDPLHHLLGLSVTLGSGNRSSRLWDWARRGFPSCPHNRMTTGNMKIKTVNHNKKFSKIKLILWFTGNKLFYGN